MTLFRLGDRSIVVEHISYVTDPQRVWIPDEKQTAVETNEWEFDVVFSGDKVTYTGDKKDVDIMHSSLIKILTFTGIQK